MSSLKEVTDSTFDREVLQSSIPVLVDFWAPWCGPCRMQTPILENVQKKVEEKASILKLNTDENAQISQKFQISSIPTLILFKDGAVVKRMVGVQNEETLLHEFAQIS